MKQYNKPRIEVIYTMDITTASPETGFIPFNSTQPIDVEFLNPVNEKLYEDVPNS